MKIYNHNIQPSIIQKTSFKASENESIKTDKKNNDNLTDRCKSKMPNITGAIIGGVTTGVMARKIENIFSFTAIMLIGTFIGGGIGSIFDGVVKYIDKAAKSNKSDK
jgi:hypothetical protein